MHLFYLLFQIFSVGMAATPPVPRAPLAQICPRPELLQTGSVSDSAATLTWTDVSNAYAVELRPANQAFTGIPTHFVVGSPPLVATQLLPGTNYHFQVRAICDQDTSLWSQPRAFQTDLNNKRPCPLALELNDTSCNNTQVFRLHVDEAPGLALGVDLALQSVRLIIEHPWRADLSVWLHAPDGSRVKLVDNLNPGDRHLGALGGGGACGVFVALTDAPHAQPWSAAAERDHVTGDFKPVEPLTTLHNGQSPIGIWRLEICDKKNGDRGILRLAHLDFAPLTCAAPNAAQWLNNADIAFPATNNADSLIVEYGPAGFIPGLGSAGGGGAVLRLAPPFPASATLPGLSERAFYDVYLRKKCAFGGAWSGNSRVLRFYYDCPATLHTSFESGDLCNDDCNTPCEVSPLWFNVHDDDLDWKLRQGPGLNHPTSGPPAASGGLQYAFFRNSCSPSGVSGKRAALRSRCVNLVAPSGSGCHIGFDLYMHTQSGPMAALALEISTDGGLNWSQVAVWSGNRGKRWRREYVDLSAWHSQTVQLQWVANSALGAFGDLAIDEIKLYGAVQANQEFVYFADADADGYGNALRRIFSCSPTPPPGYTAQSGDCDDGNPLVFPGAPETRCNGIDENCNGQDDNFIPAPAAPDADVCVGEGVSLNAIGAPVGQYFWFAGPVGGAPIAGGAQLTLPSVVRDTTFWLADSIPDGLGLCSSVRVPVRVFARPVPILSVSQPQTPCQGATFDLSQMQVHDAAGSGGILSWHAGLPANSGNELAAALVTALQGAEYAVRSVSPYGCESAIAFSIAALPNPTAAIAQGDSVSACKNRQIALQAQASGGSGAPYQYAWSGGQSSQNIQIPSGAVGGLTQNVAVTVSDAKGCSAQALVKAHTINHVNQAAIDAKVNPSVCGGADGSIAITPINGSPPYLFQWSGPSAGALNHAGGQAVLGGLSQGGYRVTLTDATGDKCPFVFPQIVLSAPGLSVSLDSVSHPRCPGDQTGAIYLSVNGLDPDISWSNGQSGSSVQHLPAGLYSVTVSDGNCTQAIENIEIKEPDPFNISGLRITDVLCFGQSNGSVQLEISGGTPPYAYLWSDSSAAQNLLNKSAGQYRLTVTDARDCLFETPEYAIGQPPPLSVLSSVVQTPLCNGVAEGAVTANAIGGVPPYAYAWNSGAASAQISMVPAGLYAVTVSDANNCTASHQSIVTQPPPVGSGPMHVTSPTCVGASDGRIVVSPSGGVAPYVVSWNTGAVGDTLQGIAAGAYVAVIADANGCSSTLEPLALTAPQLLSITLDSLRPVFCFSEKTGLIALSVDGAEPPLSVLWNGQPGALMIENIGAGIYEVAITDARGCTIGASYTVAQPPVAFSLNVSEVKNALCHGESNGRISIRTNGGTPPYAFTWSNGAVTQNLSAVPAGEYTVTASDAYGCIAVLGPLSVGQPPQLNALATPVHIPCIGPLVGSILLSVSGGVPPYQYLWSGGQTTKDIFNLHAGTYSVTVLDATGCAKFVEDIEVIDFKTRFGVSPLVVRAVSCPGEEDGLIVVNATNGTAPYQFAWSQPIGLHSGVQAPIDSALALSGGTYRVTVTDAAGCKATSPDFLIEEAPTILVGVTSLVAVACKGDSTGAITIAASGGLPPLQYQWSHGVAAANLQNLPAGTYQLTVTDLRQCTGVLPAIQVPEPAAALQTQLDSIRHDRCGRGEGAIFQKTTGGTPPYQWQWSSGAGGSQLSKLFAGAYQVNVVDAKGCVAVSPWWTVNALADSLYVSQANITPISCFGANDGSIVVQTLGGTPPVEYFWSNAATGPALAALAPGIYTLTLSDSRNCTSVYTYPLGAPAPIALSWQSDSLPDGWRISLQIAGGTPPYSVQWGPSAGAQTGPVASGLASGTHAFTVTDANGCLLSSQITVGVTGDAQAPEWLVGALLWPNPAHDWVQVEVRCAAPTRLKARVWSAGGVLHFENECDHSDRHQIRILTADWPPGVYVVELRNEQGATRHQRLVKF
ncbi:MAG: MopE-related protein [Saprospiraceae bacterium]